MDDPSPQNPAVPKAPSTASGPSAIPSDNSKQPLFEARHLSGAQSPVNLANEQPVGGQLVDGPQVATDPEKSLLGVDEIRDAKQDLKTFCQFLGLNPNNGMPLIGQISTYRKIRWTYWTANAYYGLLFSVSLLILLSQVVLSATASVLAASNKGDRHNTAILVLNAVVTVISFIAGSLKSQGEPTRARQYRDALRICKDKADKAYSDFKPDSESSFGRSSVKYESPRKVAQDIYDLFEQVQRDGMANMPDVWAEGNPTVGAAAQRGRPV